MTARPFAPWLLLLAAAAALPATAGTGPLLSGRVLAAIPLLSVSAEPQPSTLPRKGAALDYASPVALALSSDEAGAWTQADGRAIWRLKLHGDEARNLSLHLNRLQLPDDSRLRLYDGDGLLWHGPYTAGELGRQGEFWTPIVPGATLLIELSVPAGAREQAHVGIATLQHGYRDFGLRTKSGSCNIDVACPEADPWTDEVRATARITVGGQRLCSAVLLNNTRRNGDPLLLTAGHCGIGGQDGFSASSVVVYWNYETSRCGGAPDGSLRQNQSGSTLLARGDSADFSLVRLNRAPPESYGVYYAGWDSTGIDPRSGATLHHPSGDEKRISLYSQPARKRTANVDGEPVQSWEVFWSDGVTEPGSSGSGLWNSQRRVIGQLSGGNSSCDRQGASDVYGRLDVAWQEGSSPSGQLRPWLDPAATGERAIDGLDSQSRSLQARSESLNNLPADRDQVFLNVLANDGGVPPLRLIDAVADDGAVRIVDNRLVYDWRPGAADDRITYQVMDRWGDTRSATVTLERDFEIVPARGGSLGGGVLVLLLAAGWWRRRR